MAPQREQTSRLPGGGRPADRPSASTPGSGRRGHRPEPGCAVQRLTPVVRSRQKLAPRRCAEPSARGTRHPARVTAPAGPPAAAAAASSTAFVKAATAESPSPCSMARTPWCAVIAASKQLVVAGERRTRSRSGTASQARVLKPSTSVNRNVTVPVGRGSGSAGPITHPRLGTTMPCHGLSVVLPRRSCSERDHGGSVG